MNILEHWEKYVKTRRTKYISPTGSVGRIFEIYYNNQLNQSGDKYVFIKPTPNAKGSKSIN